MAFAKSAGRRRMDGELSSSEDGLTNIPANGSDVDLDDSSETSEQVKCPHCGTIFAADAAFCPHCKWPRGPLSLEQRAVAVVGYLTFVPAAVILFLPSFRRDRFVRFNAWQSILLWGTFFVLTVVALFVSNVAAAMVFLLFGILISLAMLFLWIVLSIKSWKGERFEIPLFGELAARLP
jgi:uncharacterized membrane protein